jgi:hypothetical protein
MPRTAYLPLLVYGVILHQEDSYSLISIENYKI